MFKALFEVLKFAFKKVTKLSIPYFSLEENDIKLKISTDCFYKHTLYNIEMKTRHDSYVYEAYTIKSDNVFLEYIHTYEDVYWNKDSFSSFLSLLKDALKATNFEKLEQKSFTHYDFYAYRVDDSYNIFLISLYEMNKNLFIVDFKGDLYTNLILNFDKTYIFNYENKKALKCDINISLVKNNAMNEYFKLASS